MIREKMSDRVGFLDSGFPSAVICVHLRINS